MPIVVEVVLTPLVEENDFIRLSGQMVQKLCLRWMFQVQLVQSLTTRLYDGPEKKLHSIVGQIMTITLVREILIYQTKTK